MTKIDNILDKLLDMSEKAAMSSKKEEVEVIKKIAVMVADEGCSKVGKLFLQDIIKK